MAEPGKREESQPAQGTEHELPPNIDEFASYVAERIAAAHGLHGAWELAQKVHGAWELAQELNAPDITIDVTETAPTAERPSASSHLLLKISRHQLSGESEAAAPLEVSESTKSGPPSEDKDSYYDELRQAVGRGAPTVLLGTSTRSLKRSFQKLKAVRQADIDRPSSPASSEPQDLTETLRASVAAAKRAKSTPPKKEQSEASSRDTEANC